MIGIIFKDQNFIHSSKLRHKHGELQKRKYFKNFCIVIKSLACMLKIRQRIQDRFQPMKDIKCNTIKHI